MFALWFRDNEPGAIHLSQSELNIVNYWKIESVAVKLDIQTRLKQFLVENQEIEKPTKN